MSSWKFSSIASGAEEYIKIHIANFPSVCIRRENGTAVGWFIVQKYGAMGMLYVVPEYRGKGLARYLVTKLTRKMLRTVDEAFVAIEEDNAASIQLHKKCGFCVGGTICWLNYHPA